MVRLKGAPKCILVAKLEIKFKLIFIWFLAVMVKGFAGCLHSPGGAKENSDSS